jgi:hypothetical protein
MLVRLSFFIMLLFFALSGCSDEDVVPKPTNHLLTSYFIPIPGSSNYEWTHQDERLGVKDSIYTLTYVGRDIIPSIDALSPVSLLQINTGDSGNMRTFQNKYYVSDSLVVSYGLNALTDSERVVLLKDTLSVGKSWLAAEQYRSADGMPIQLAAVVDAYYAMIHIGNKDYSDVYRITYYPTPVDTTIDEAFKKDARHVYYYARGVGKVLEMVYASDSSLVWKNELVREQ